MKKLLLSVILLLILAVAMPVFAQDGQWPRTLVDGLGNEVTIEAPPQRLATLSLSVDAILLELVGPERFVAVTALAQDPGISNVSLLASTIDETIVTADAEFIIGLEPDVVIVASFTNPDVVQQLRDAGLVVFTTSSPSGFQPIREAILQLGEVVGEEEGAAGLVARMDAEIEAVGAAVSTVEEPLRVMYLTPGNFTSGSGSSIAAVIEAAGGIDVAAAAGIDQFAPVSDEFIIEQNPDVLLLSGWTPWDPAFIATFFDNPAFADLKAVQTGQVFIGNDAHLATVSHYISEGVKDVAAYLYPDLYPVFPVTVTDAAGNALTVEDAPTVVKSLSVESDALLELLAVQLGDAALSIVFSDEVATDGVAPQVTFGTEADTGVFVLHAGASAPAVATNLQLLGDVLGARAAAQNAIALYTDEVEAALAAES